MEKTWLIQRLKAPWPQAVAEEPVPVKGILCGKKHISQQDGKALGTAFRLDYMGAAEFEYGTFPESLGAFAARSDCLVAFTVATYDFAKNHRRAYNVKKEELPPPPRKAKLYVICHCDDAVEVTLRVMTLAKESGNYGEKRSIILKEGTMLNVALDPLEPYDNDYKGWYELNNGFFFFTCPDMFAAVCNLFDVKVLG